MRLSRQIRDAMVVETEDLRFQRRRLIIQALAAKAPLRPASGYPPDNTNLLPSGNVYARRPQAFPCRSAQWCHRNRFLMPSASADEVDPALSD